jgi:hypothetical protein
MIYHPSIVSLSQPEGSTRRSMVRSDEQEQAWMSMTNVRTARDPVVMVAEVEAQMPVLAGRAARLSPTATTS